MKIFNKPSKLEHVSYDIRGLTLDEATCTIANGEKILRLNTGNPAEFDFTVPDEVIRDLIANTRNSEAYLGSKRIFSIYKAVVQYYQLKGFLCVGTDDTYLGNGVLELASMSLQALLDDDDEVLVPISDYPLWTACVSLAGGSAVYYLCDEKANRYLDINSIRSKTTFNTEVIVVINPNNPAGVLYLDEFPKRIVEAVHQNDLIIFADEIYDRLVMDGKEHIAIASLVPDVFCVSVNGLSKSRRICGSRVGWMVLSGPRGNARGYTEELNMLASTRPYASVSGQHVVQTSLGSYQSVDGLLAPGGRTYEQRNFIHKAVSEVPGPSVVRSDAGLYISSKTNHEMYQIDDDGQFYLELLKQEKAILAPGKGFNWNEPDHFRIVYLPHAEELAEVREKSTRVLNQYRC